MKRARNLTQNGNGRENRANARRFVPIAALLAVINLGAFAQPVSPLAAHWDGAIQLQDHLMGITLDLSKNPAGQWIGSVSIVDARIVDAPLMQISVDGSTVRFKMGISHDSFEGKVSDDGGVMSGTAASDEGAAPFNLKRSGDANVKVPPSSTTLSTDFEGNWEGTLDAPGKQLRAVLKLTRGSGGVAVGTLISLDEGAQEFPITTITQKDRRLQFEILVIGAKYTGTLDGSGAQIAGDYTQGGLTLPLAFKRAGAAAKQ
jgi:hypothetical protein